MKFAIIAAFVACASVDVDAMKLNLKQQSRMSAMTRSNAFLKVGKHPTNDQFRDLEGRLIDASDKAPGVDFKTFSNIVYRWAKDNDIDNPPDQY